MFGTIIAAASLLAASQGSGQGWQRPDCSAFESFRQCRKAETDGYRRHKQLEFRHKGLSFWYFERPDFSADRQSKWALRQKVEGALYFSFTVERDGSVSDVWLKSKTSDAVAVYAQPILIAIKNWQFVPSQRSWPDQEWRYQFFFEANGCAEGVEMGAGKDASACRA